MSSEFKILTGDDVNGFNSVIELYGFSIDDFEIAEVWRSRGDLDSKIITNEIRVIRKSSDVEAVYDLDYKSVWPTEFEDDLKHGAFGQIEIGK
jgi:hypothetical protein